MKISTAALLFSVAVAASFATHASAAAAACTNEQMNTAASAANQLQNFYIAHKHAEMGAPWDRLVESTCNISPIQYKFGALAERARGDIAAALKNYAKSNEASEVPKLKAAYGYVNIMALSMPQPRALIDISPGHNLSEEERAVLNRAARSVNSPGKFHGYLPGGKYKLGGKEFIVTPGETIDVNVP